MSRSFTANDVLEMFFDDQSSSDKIVVKLTTPGSFQDST